MAAGYRVHMGDLEKAVGLEPGELVRLSELAGQSAGTQPDAAGPSDRLLEYFRIKGRQPGFEKLPQESWLELAAKEGVSVARADFAAAWRIAVQRGYVVPLDGAPKLEQQSKPLRRALAEGTTPQAQPKKATAT